MPAEAHNPGRVTILLSTYNGSRFLQQQLESLYAQNYPNVRILVRDDGSTDSTCAILRRELAKGRLELLEEGANLGAAMSFFRLLKKAASTDTEFVAFCDQDDVWLPDKIANAVSSLKEYSGVVPAIYCSRLELVDERLAHIGYTEVPRKIGFGNALVENVAIGCTMLLNREAIWLIGENLPARVVIHDWWCYLVVSCFGEVVFDDRSGIRYRQHGSNAIGVGGNTLDGVARKFRRFFGRGSGHRWMSEQASTLRDIFGNRIPLAQRNVLDSFIKAGSSFMQRTRMAISAGIWRQRHIDDLLLRLLILVNRV